MNADEFFENHSIDEINQKFHLFRSDLLKTENLINCQG